MTHRLISALLIAASTLSLLAQQLGVFPASWRPYILMASVVALALSQSVQAVVKGQGQ